MSAKTVERDPLLGAPKASHAEEPAWLGALRAAASQGLEDKGLPTKKDEAWRFTPTSPIVRAGLVAEAFDEEPKGEWVEAARALLPEPAGPRLFLVDGRLVPDDSTALPSDVEVRSLAEVLRDDPESLEDVLGTVAESAYFADLNQAAFEDGVVIRQKAGTIVEAPVELVHVSPKRAPGRVVHPRVVIELGDGAQMRLIETHLGVGNPEGHHLDNRVTEIALGEEAHLDHVVVHRDVGFLISSLASRLSRASSYRSHVLTFGGRLLRMDATAYLVGEGASVELDGIYLAEDDDHVDHHLRVVHRAPHCSSNQLYRGVVDGKATAVFDGIAVVERGAQRTEAHQENRNILLSDKATVHTKPHLEIDADDVVCSHGATVGSLDDDQLFYLRSRGIPKPIANALLTFAFLRQVVDRIPEPIGRERLVREVLDRLPGGDALGGIQ